MGQQRGVPALTFSVQTLSYFAGFLVKLETAQDAVIPIQVKFGFQVSSTLSVEVILVEMGFPLCMES